MLQDEDFALIEQLASGNRHLQSLCYRQVGSEWIASAAAAVLFECQQSFGIRAWKSDREEAGKWQGRKLARMTQLHRTQPIVMRSSVIWWHCEQEYIAIWYRIYVCHTSKPAVPKCTTVATPLVPGIEWRWYKMCYLMMFLALPSRPMCGSQ